MIVIPNCVDPEEWQPQPRNGDIRMGWSGATNHFSDLALVMDAIREVQKKHAFTFVIQGICRDEASKRFTRNTSGVWEAFRHVPLWKVDEMVTLEVGGNRHEFHPAVEID